MSNDNNKVLYTGVTSELKRRVYKHKIKAYHRSYTARYNVKKLVYFERYEHLWEAINREKQIKAGSRQKKIDLINSMNPAWEDLYETF